MVGQAVALAVIIVVVACLLVAVVIVIHCNRKTLELHKTLAKVELEASDAQRELADTILQIDAIENIREEIGRTKTVPSLDISSNSGDDEGWSSGGSTCSDEWLSKFCRRPRSPPALELSLRCVWRVPAIEPTITDAGSAASATGTEALATGSAIPNALLVSAMAGKVVDIEQVTGIARRISDTSYALRDFFDDCRRTFPELSLYVARDSRTSGLVMDDEYQRTTGALMAVYWLMRLGSDGKRGFSLGVDSETWAVKGPSDFGVATPGAGCSFFKMSAAEKKLAFLFEVDCVESTGFRWAMLQDLLADAGLYEHGCECASVSGDSGGSCARHDRIVAMLCLTVIHDVMKNQDLLPVVQQEHAPYHGVAAGERIYDHDVALSYVLEHYPSVLPSFACLSGTSRELVLFASSRMNFNHGWFVQGEAPPRAMLSAFKSVVGGGTCPSFIAFYFVQWITDLAGAVPTPLAGMEKLTANFPHFVLTSFLWSMPFLGRLAQQTETQVYEEYLAARWESHPSRTELPRGPDAIALLRLMIMTQSEDAEMVLGAYSTLSDMERKTLASEMAMTAIAGQSYAARGKASGATGPAFLIYYGPALLQVNRRTKATLACALHVLCRVYRAARKLWPACAEQEEVVVKINIAALKAIPLSAFRAVAESNVCVLAKLNNTEGAVKMYDLSKDLDELDNLYYAVAHVGLRQHLAELEPPPSKRAKATANRSPKLVHRRLHILSSPPSDTAAAPPPPVRYYSTADIDIDI